MIFKKWGDSINYAIEGVLHAARTQKHVRLHLIVIIILLLFCFVTGLQGRDFIIVSLIATIVVVTEMLNSAIETIVDMLSPKRNEYARIAKYMAAGAVLIGAVSSIITAFYIIVPDLLRWKSQGFAVARHSSPDIALCSALVVLISVIILKAYFGKGHPLRGGMPSGHASLSFSFFVSSLYLFSSHIVLALVLVAAVAISVSRVIQKIHTPLEVFAGCLVGSVMTWGIFKIFI